MSTDETTELEVLELPDEDGNDIEFAVLDRIEIEGVTYAVLATVEQLEAEEPEIDFYIFVWNELEDGGLELDAVEDDDIVEAVLDAAQENWDDGEGDDDDWDDDEPTEQ